MNEQIRIALQHVVNLQLGQALEALENYLLTYSYPKERERLTRLQEDYHRMMEYWERGFQDDRREEVYLQLLQRVYRVVGDLAIDCNLRQSPFATNVAQRSRRARSDWSLTAVMGDLENFVSDQAMLELMPQHTRDEAEQQLYDRHQSLMNDLFDYIWTSPTWNESLGDAFIDLLLSPTIDSNDQQLMVSAVTLSLQNFFDYEKERVLMEVYRRTTDQRVRQRALVGWGLSVNGRCNDIYPELKTLLQQLLADETCRQELKELQIQLVYCMTAEEDSRKAHDEMFSEIMKNGGSFRITPNGIEEVEEDTLEDILHPEASEQRLEKLETAANKMLDMQRAGSDIYFTGFVQMKRFSFFSDTCNWFMPFYSKHPALRAAMSDKRRSRIMLRMLRSCPFCNSDSYSFVLGFMNSINQIPEKLLEMLDRGELALLGDQMDNKAKGEPAFIRREYLQDLFRFYRLFPSRSVFVNPFEKPTADERLFFFANPLFSHNTPLANDLVEVAAFLTKKQLYETALEVLRRCSKEVQDERYYLLCAAVMKHHKDKRILRPNIKLCYQMVLKDNPEHDGALKGLARELFTDGEFLKALDIYEKLLSHHPDNQHYLLNKAVCLQRLQRYEEALEILYKMYYEQPDDQTISSVLAWTLVGAGKLEQAAKIYEQLTQEAEVQDNNLLNSGFCLWLMGNVKEAAERFRTYIAASKGDNRKALSFEEEVELLRRHGISDVEIRLMTDLVRGLS